MIVDHKLNTSQQGDAAAKKANIHLGCINSSVVCKTQEGIVQLYSALMGISVFSAVYHTLGRMWIN